MITTTFNAGQGPQLMPHFARGLYTRVLVYGWTNTTEQFVIHDVLSEKELTN